MGICLVITSEWPPQIVAVLVNRVWDKKANSVTHTGSCFCSKNCAHANSQRSQTNTLMNLLATTGHNNELTIYAPTTAETTATNCPNQFHSTPSGCFYIGGAETLRGMRQGPPAKPSDQMLTWPVQMLRR